MIWARWAAVMGVPMKWEIARIFVVGTGGSGFCAEAAPSGVIGFFMAVAPYSSLGILLLIVSVFDAWTASAGRRHRHQPSVGDSDSRKVVAWRTNDTWLDTLSTRTRPPRAALSSRPPSPPRGEIPAGVVGTAHITGVRACRPRRRG